MSAVGSAVVPLYEEGLEFWSELSSECRRQVDKINALITTKGIQDEHLQVMPGQDLQIVKPGYPSTTLTASLQFHSWGPVIRGTVRGWEEKSLQYFPHEFELSVARDLDTAVVAIYEEGKSFSPTDLARFLTQSFRRCFPGVSLPC